MGCLQDEDVASKKISCHWITSFLLAEKGEPWARSYTLSTPRKEVNRVDLIASDMKERASRTSDLGWDDVHLANWTKGYRKCYSFNSCFFLQQELIYANFGVSMLNFGLVAQIGMDVSWCFLLVKIKKIIRYMFVQVQKSWSGMSSWYFRMFWIGWKHDDEMHWIRGY